MLGGQTDIVIVTHMLPEMLCRKENGVSYICMETAVEKAVVERVVKGGEGGWGRGERGGGRVPASRWRLGTQRRPLKGGIRIVKPPAMSDRGQNLRRCAASPLLNLRWLLGGEGGWGGGGVGGQAAAGRVRAAAGGPLQSFSLEPTWSFNPIFTKSKI